MLSPVKMIPQIFASTKFPPGKNTSNEIPSPYINHTNERKNKVTKFLALKKGVQYNILTYWAYILSIQNEKNPKIERKRKSPSDIYLPVVQVKEN